MDEMLSASTKTKPRRRKGSKSSSSSSSCFSFTACFGMSKSNEKKQLETSKSGGRKKKVISWFFWPQFRIKSSSTKTVPVDSGIVVVDWKPTIVEQKKPKITVVKDQIENHKATTKEKNKSLQNTMLECRAKENILPDTCLKPIIACRKTDPKRSSSSQSTSPTHNPNRSRALIFSKSLPSTPFNPRKLSHLARNSQNQGNKRASREDKRSRNFDPVVVGLSILMVTLVFLSISGRIIAILCTSMSLYAGPRLRAMKSDDDVAGENESISELPDFDSEGYKKRVVLEGLLERSHRHAGTRISPSR